MMYSDLDTPAVLIDLDIAEANIQRFQDYCDKHGFKLRPHIKTHKLPLMAKKQLEAGAIGITCQKIGEAEVMARSGIKDILITYNILGQNKLTRLLALAQTCTLSVVADNSTVIQGLSETFADSGIILEVLVECDTGAARCGVQSPEDALVLAQEIDRADGLTFGGLMTYPKSGQLEQTQSWLARAVQICAKAGLNCRVVSNGGTPDMWQADKMPATTEYRIGTYIYNDRSLINYGTCDKENCALTVMATIVSIPTDDRVIIDAGSKTLTSDLLGLEGYGLILDHPDLSVTGLSEEHGEIRGTHLRNRFKIGDRVRIIPNHACVVSNMVDEVHLIRNHQVEQTAQVSARGKII